MARGRWMSVAGQRVYVGAVNEEVVEVCGLDGQQYGIDGLPRATSTPPAKRLVRTDDPVVFHADGRATVQFWQVAGGT